MVRCWSRSPPPTRRRAIDSYFDRYLTALKGYSYAEYRNQSLWFLLAEAVKHPNPNWVKAMTARRAAKALSPAGADFQEGTSTGARAAGGGRPTAPSGA